MGKKLNLSPEEIKAVVDKSNSALQASKLLDVTYTSFLRYAKKYNLFFKNQGGRGLIKSKGRRLHKIEDILSNAAPCGSSSLKRRLYESHLKKNECEECRQTSLWNNKALIMHLDHIDGNKFNNKIENLKILCPNCHTQTSTYCRGQYKTGKTLQFKKSDLVKKTKKVVIKSSRTAKERIDAKWEPFKEKIINANIDFSKLGWVLSVSDILSTTPQYTRRWMKMYLPEINSKAYIRGKMRV